MPVQVKQQRFSLITEKGLADLRQLIGVPIEDTLEPWCHEATCDNIRHWAHGIGDDNPLWCDPAYAAKSPYGRLVAPPSFIYPLNRVFSGYVGGLPGVHAMFAGMDVTWHKPMLHGDEFTTKVWLKDLVEHQTRFAGRSIQQIYRCEFFNQDIDLVAEGDSWLWSLKIPNPPKTPGFLQHSEFLVATGSVLGSRDRSLSGRPRAIVNNPQTQREAMRCLNRSATKRAQPR